MVLAKAFLKRYAQEFEKPISAIDGGARALLMDYLWPGNVRELENVIVHAVVTCDGDTITVDHIKREVRESTADDPDEFEPGMTLDDAERMLIQKTLEMVGGKKIEAARVLGISRKGFYNKVKKHGL